MVLILSKQPVFARLIPKSVSVEFTSPQLRTHKFSVPLEGIVKIFED